MNQSLLDEDKKDIINFLCKPVVSPKKIKKIYLMIFITSIKKKNLISSQIKSKD